MNKKTVFAVIIAAAGLMFAGCSSASVTPTTATTAPTSTPSTTAATTAQVRTTNAYYPVTSDPGGFAMAEVIMADGGSQWAGNNVYPTRAVCGLNRDSTVSYSYNCNVTFSSGVTTSYWIATNNDNYTWSATPRLHQ